MPVPFLIDRRLATPLHRQIYEQWREGILSGRFRRRTRVPSTRAFAAAYGVSRATATAAYEQLLAEGYFESAVGAGTFVCSELPDDARRAVRRMPVARGASPARLSRFASRLDLDPRVQPAPGRLNLSNLGPDLGLFPFPLWRRVLTRHLRRLTAPTLDHFAPPAGSAMLRREIAAYVARSRAVRCTPEQVVVVSGSQQGLDLCARLLVDPGDEVAVEDPGYGGMTYLLRAHGAVVRPLPVTADGASIRRLSGNPRLVFVTPSHQFPTGASMSLARRLELLQWAARCGTVVVEDDYDSEFRYTGAPLPAMQSLTTGIPVVYVGTFSNVMFPSLRIGYLVLPTELVAPFTRAKWLTDRHTPLLEQAALADFLADGHLERHIRRMRRIYKARREVMMAALEQHFGDRISVLGDAAGMHLTARVQVRDLAARGERAGVHIRSTAPYYSSDPPPDEFLFGFASMSERAIREAVRRLASA
jgi:GntR family transcriptional regulator/MocR family aminotransferase